MIPIPRTMNHLKLDKRGYPVPYTVMCGVDGTPYFTINDSAKQHKCARERRCSVCGKRITGLFWFVGGPLSAFHEHGAYADNALHDECAHFTLVTCPYIAARNYLHRIDAAGVAPGNLPESMVFMDPTMLPDRPKYFVAIAAKSYEYRPDLRINMHLRPARPYARVEFWLNGQQISEIDADRLSLSYDLDIAESLATMVDHATRAAH
jgi:hypothetical protein